MRKIYLNIILAIAFVLIVYIFLFVPTWFHEQGHIREAMKQGMNFYYRFNGLSLDTLLMKIPIGVAIPSSSKDCERFNSLSNTDKEKITHAGVIPAIISFTIIYWIIVLFLNFKRKIPKSFWLLLLLMYLMYVFLTLWNDVLSRNPLNDWHLVNISNCSRFG